MPDSSDYTKALQAQWMLNGQSMPVLASIWVGLAIGSVFTDSSYASECTGTGYARVQLTSGFTIVGGEGTNNVKVTFPIAGSDWGSVVGFGLFDAASGGNMLAHKPVTAAQDISTGNRFQFNEGDMTVKFGQP